jgi:two-component system, OmpR family, phosphate regulon response regulator OmpR
MQGLLLWPACLVNPVTGRNQIDAFFTMPIGGRYHAGMIDQRHLLVVDDDPKLRELLQRYLTEQQFEVTLASDATSMNRVLVRGVFDLIILDLMMPGEDGLSIVRRLRTSGDQTPVIMLTAKGDDVDRIVGLEMGADDYLAKPFNPRELLARISAVLRRQRVQQTPGAPAQVPAQVKFGEFILDMGLRRLTRGSEEIILTTGEFGVLRVFAQHPRITLSREKLMVLARGREYGAYDRSLDVQISRLRKLIEQDPAKPQYLQTVWGVGYVFVPDPV